VKRPPADWLLLAGALLRVRTAGRDALRQVDRLEAHLSGQREALALLAAIELRLIGVTEEARRALKARRA